MNWYIQQQTETTWNYFIDDSPAIHVDKSYHTYITLSTAFLKPVGEKIYKSILNMAHRTCANTTEEEFQDQIALIQAMKITSQQSKKEILVYEPEENLIYI